MHKRVQVCIRIRPAVASSESKIETQDQSILLPNSANGKLQFQYDQILQPTVAQAQVYDEAARPVIESVLNGYNGTILAYGQTGSGKTFTMTGAMENYATRGICARAISHVFQAITAEADSKFSIRLSYAEVYNEQLYDLFQFKEPDGASSVRKSDLCVMETKSGSTFVRGLSRPIVETEEEALELMFQGETNRTIAEHCLNKSSTRSHCILTIYVEKRSAHDEEAPTVTSKLHLVDLAGSERMKKTNASGVLLKEANHINKSLSFLEQVVIALGDKTRGHIPYRQSLLTNLLKDSLGGNCRTLMIACIWTDESQLDQTVATLKFATRMMRVKTSAVVNVRQDTSKQAQLYRLEIDKLKKELAMYDILSRSNQTGENPRQPFSPEQLLEMETQVLEFLQDNTDQISLPILSVMQIETLFHLFKQVHRESKRHRDQQVHHQVPVPPVPETTTLEPRPKEVLVPPSTEKKESNKQSFEAFRGSPEGRELNLKYEMAKSNIKKTKKQTKALVAKVNEAKSEIDRLKQASKTLEKKLDEEGGEDNEVLQQLKAKKKLYREIYDELEETKAEMKFLQRAKDQCFRALVSEFEALQAKIQ